MTDTCLRDGSHPKRHQFTEQQVHDIVAALDAAGVPVIEVTHGDGLGGSSFNYGFSRRRRGADPIAAETAKPARIAALMLPGVGTMDDIRAAQDNGGESAGSRPTAPRPTCRASTSRWRASSGWRRSAS